MILFTEEHKEWILRASPYTGCPKTQTRRFWNKPRAKAGSIHQARTKMFGKPFARLLIREVWSQKVRDITLSDVRAEGYKTCIEFWMVLCEVNHIPLIRMNKILDRDCYAVRFELQEALE